MQCQSATLSTVKREYIVSPESKKGTKSSGCATNMAASFSESLPSKREKCKNMHIDAIPAVNTFDWHAKRGQSNGEYIGDEAAGGLDQFLTGNASGSTSLANQQFTSGFLISIPARRSKNVDFGWESDNRNMDMIEDDLHSDSGVSEITHMTFRAELMKEALLEEYRKLKQRMLAKEMSSEQEQGLKSNGKETSSFHNENNPSDCPKFRFNLSRTTSVLDFSENFKCQWDGKTRHALQMLEEEDTQGEDLDNVDVSGKLAVDADLTAEGLGLKLPEIGNIKQDAAPRVENPDEEPENREWYIDSIIELKLQLAQKQSLLDEVSSKYNRAQFEKEFLNKRLAETSESLKKSTEEKSIAEYKIRSLKSKNAKLRIRLREMKTLLSSSGQCAQTNCELAKEDPSSIDDSISTSTTASSSNASTKKSADKQKVIETSPENETERKMTGNRPQLGRSFIRRALDGFDSAMNETDASNVVVPRRSMSLAQFPMLLRRRSANDASELKHCKKDEEDDYFMGWDDASCDEAEDGTTAFEKTEVLRSVSG